RQTAVDAIRVAGIVVVADRRAVRQRDLIRRRLIRHVVPEIGHHQLVARRTRYFRGLLEEVFLVVLTLESIKAPRLTLAPVGWAEAHRVGPPDSHRLIGQINLALGGIPDLA